MDMLSERWGGGIALSGFMHFWNRKTGEEGYTTRPLSRYADQVREWAYGFWAAVGKQADVLVWQASEAGLESGIGECLGGGVRQGKVARPPPGRRTGVLGPQARLGLFQMVRAVALYCGGCAVCNPLDSSGGHRPQRPPGLGSGPRPQP